MLNNIMIDKTFSHESELDEMEELILLWRIANLYFLSFIYILCHYSSIISLFILKNNTQKKNQL